ncbi:MAG: dihydropteroate synthase [Acidimicrobiia bacterium]|nr:dihydropteroate synthase [Acidimicrobiia bacterium]
MRRLRLANGELGFGNVTHVMAVINVSPESKNISSVASSPDQALAMARSFRDAGATVIDIGGQSSHYDNPTIDAEVELDRLLPAVRRLADDGFIVSVDTWKPEVAAACIDAGACLVNDTGGLASPDMRQVASRPGVAAIVMYIEGSNPHDVGEVDIRPDKASVTAKWMEGRLGELEAAGVTQTIIDPGISINYRGDYDAYTRMQLEVIRGIGELASLERPVLVPIPRKREDHRVASYITLALEHGADMIRVHDVEMACDLVRLYDRSAVR